MALYNLEDIKTTTSGDLVVSKKGDLDLSNSLETYKSVVKFLVKTDWGEYVPMYTVGCNLGNFVGEINVEKTHNRMESSIRDSISKVFSQTDFDVVVSPFDMYEVVCFVFLAGTYLVDNEYRKFNQERITFTFPLLEGNPTELAE